MFFNQRKKARTAKHHRGAKRRGGENLGSGAKRRSSISAARSAAGEFGFFKNIFREFSKNFEEFLGEKTKNKRREAPLRHDAATALQ